MSFLDLQLDPRILQAVEAAGFKAPSEIQRQAIPVAMAGRDLMASAQTGTGKTAAFVLPALQRLLEPSASPSRGPRVLVLTPTRELAVQITAAVQQFSRNLRLRFGAIVGGVPYPPQEKLLRAPLDFLIATPGRLIDHMDRGRLDFSRLELLVLDEADRMLDMGFVDDVERIAQATPKQRQTLLFSATLEGDIEKIARRLLREPARVQIDGIKTRHESITQSVYQADGIKHKHALISHLLQAPEVSQAIVFMSTKRGADQLATTLSDSGLSAAALHGDMNQGARNRTVEKLRNRRVQILVATDVAARGLDVRGISHVINFDLPMKPEDYVHRIGRTGRGGDVGIAASLVGPEEWHQLARIERLTGQRLERNVIPGLEPTRPLNTNSKPGAPAARRNDGPRRAPHRSSTTSHTEERKPKVFVRYKSPSAKPRARTGE